MAGSVIDPAPRVVESVRTGGVQPTEISVHPRQGGDDGHAKAAQGQEPSDAEEEDGADGEPYGAGDKDQRGKEDETQRSDGDGEASEDEQDGAGDEKGQESDELAGVWRMVLEFSKECGVGFWGSSLGLD